MRIPLYLRPAADRLIWRFDKKGIYNVKSGYFAARSIENLTYYVSTSGCNKFSKFWGSIQWVNVPPKIRTFVWRLLLGIIPTRPALSKKVSLPSSRYIYCNHWILSDIYLFNECNTLEGFQEARMSLQPKRHPARNIFDQIYELMASLPKQQV